MSHEDNSNSLQEVENYVDKIGAANISDPGLTAEKVAQYMGEELEVASLEDLENLMARIASYNIYLKAQRSELESELSVLRARLKYLLGLKTQTICEKFMSRDEKEALALSQDASLMALHKKCIETEAKLLRIRDIPFSVDKKLDFIKMKYSRRVNDLNESKFEHRCSD